MKNQLIINENEKDDILSQHDNIDPKLYNFLIRRAKVKENMIPFNDGEDPLKLIEVSFTGYPGYGFSMSLISKKDMINRIIEFLEDHEIIEKSEVNFNVFDPERQKIVKTIKKFLNFISSIQK
jgi:hypothetical protein